MVRGRPRAHLPELDLPRLSSGIQRIVWKRSPGLRFQTIFRIPELSLGKSNFKLEIKAWSRSQITVDRLFECRAVAQEVLEQVDLTSRLLLAEGRGVTELDT